MSLETKKMREKNEWTIEELEILTTFENGHPLDVYRKTFPNSKKTTANLLGIITHSGQSKKRLEKMRAERYGRRQLKPLAQIKTVTVAPIKRDSSIPDIGELLVSIKNDLVFNNTLQKEFINKLMEVVNKEWENTNANQEFFIESQKWEVKLLSELVGLQKETLALFKKLDHQKGAS